MSNAATPGHEGLDHALLIAPGGQVRRPDRDGVETWQLEDGLRWVRLVAMLANRLTLREVTDRRLGHVEDLDAMRERAAMVREKEWF